MEIQGHLLDIREDGESQCYLMKISLKNYIQSLPENYTEYDVQREVVSTNVYLDKIIDTVLNKLHIPSIVLVTDQINLMGHSIRFNEEYRIIDGLQRTHRLKSVFDTVELFKSEIKNSLDILNLSRFQLSKRYSEYLIKINSNYKILLKVIEFYNRNNIEALDNIFSDNFMWFEVWTNLNSAQRVEKMLLLNAGHKPVKLKHQLELLFINDLLQDFKRQEGLKDFTLVREKERNSISFSKSRKFGEFHFSQLIASIIAFDKGRLIVSNANLISNVQDTDFTIQELNSELSYQFIQNLVKFLLNLDKNISQSFEEGNKWLGRETSLVGLFAALGNYRKQKDITDANTVFEKFSEYIYSYPIILNLDDYDHYRQLLDYSKINFGNVNRRVVYQAITQLLNEIDKPGLFQQNGINWEIYFSNFSSSVV